jgi:hypothetical protein
VEAIHKEGDVRVLFIDLIHFAVSWSARMGRCGIGSCGVPARYLVVG